MSTLTLRKVVIVAPAVLAGVALFGATLWLWARFGLGVYVDAVLSAIAACL